MTLGLDDLCVRFIINLPRADLSTVARICFQVEEAQWFYEDFIRPLDPSLPSMSLRDFCHRIFKHCPLLAPFADHHMKAFEEFMEYKQRIPVRGAILLNEAMDSAVLVKGWKSGAGWSFPRGKINMDEDDLDCAIREVDEEIGFDLRQAGLVPKPKEIKYIDVTLKDQQIRLYVFRNVPMDTVFQPKTRKEISKIAWYKLTDLPGTRKKGVNVDGDVVPVPAPAPTGNNKFYMVAPFLGHLKKWIAQQKRRDAARSAPTSYDGPSSYLAAQTTLEEPLTEEETGAQTDVGHDEPVPAPSREVMEGADEELRRMLQLQPPTQGLQLGITEHESAQKDSGSALLALLRGGPSVRQPEQHPGQQPPQHNGSQFVYQHSVPVGHNSIPHTPLEHVHPSASQPNTPHHHHPSQILPPNGYQPPPNFPLAQHPSQSQPFQQQQPQFPHHQNQPPIHQFPPGRTGQVPLVSAANYYHNGPAHNQPFHHQQQYMNQQRMNPMGPRPQPQKAPEILHPQPLPPQAQSILTRSMLPTPQLPESNGRPIGHGTGSQGQLATREDHIPNGSQGPVHHRQGQLHQQMQPQLNSHTMSLLSAFKTGLTARAEPQASTAPQEQAARVPPMAPRGQYQEAPGSVPHTAPSAAQHGLQHGPPSLSSLMNILQQPHGVDSPSSANGPRPPHQRQQSDVQRSALLDMFKKQTPLSPGSGSDATVRSTTPIEERLGQNHMIPQPMAQIQPSGSPHASLAAPRATGGHSTGNTEQNLPFRPVQILSRAKQAENIPIAQPHGSTSPAQFPVASLQNGARHVEPLAAVSAAPSSIMTQVAAAQGRGRALHPEASNAPYNQRQPAAPLPADILQGLPHEGNPEQAKKLLSLFGKPQPPVTEHGHEGKTRDPTIPDQPKSRMASLSHTLGGGDATQGPSTSRRGSGLPPISPSDTAFLLNFLNKQTV
jgi:mRNA-decapping enzyme subunit 2